MELELANQPNCISVNVKLTTKN